MSRGILTTEPRQPGSLARVARMVISALAGSPGSSIPSALEDDGFEMETCAIDAEGEWVMASTSVDEAKEHEEANELQEAQEAEELQIAHAFGPLKDKFYFRRENDRLRVAFLRTLIFEGDIDSDVTEILKAVRNIWVVLWWAKRRAGFRAAVGGSDYTRAESLANAYCRSKLKRNPLRSGLKKANQLMKKALNEAEKESLWLQDLEEEVVNCWWTEFVKKKGNKAFEVFFFIGLHGDDIANHISDKLRDRSKANPSAASEVKIAFGDALELVKEREIRDTDFIRYAEISKDPQEKWVKISDYVSPGKPRRMLVFPSRNFGAALDVFFLVNDTDLKDMWGYVPRDIWLTHY